MFKTINAINGLVGTILSLAILAALGTGGWFAYRTYFAEKLRTERELEVREAKIAGLSRDLEARERQIERLDEELIASREQIERLETAVRLLKVDYRVAQIDVLGQEGSAEQGDLVTRFSFVEVDGQGTQLEKPRVLEVKGDMVYVDSWVVKFTDEYVEMGDPLRSTSICLFRRLFGETQKPSEAFELDPVGSRPAAYRNGGKMSDLEQEIWSKFWEYANDPVKAEKVGVRAAHGEAPFQKLVPGKRYKVLLRASGGLTFVPEDLPPDAKPFATAETL
ncbi:MAG: hypothetical protein ABIK89_07785 [Planctomycetota bacterium]